MASVFFHPYEVVPTQAPQSHRDVSMSIRPQPAAQRTTAGDVQDVYFTHIAGSGVPNGKRANTDPFDVRGIRFVLLSGDEIRRMSVVRVTVANTTPGTLNSLSDPRMGPVYGHGGVCQTCTLDYQSCPGHFGHVSLPVPVFNPMFIQTVAKLLNTVCIFCCRMRMSHVWVRLNHPLPSATAHHYATLNRLRALATTGARQTVCVHCDKLLSTFRLASNRLAIEYQSAPSTWITIPALLVYFVLANLPDADVVLLGLDPLENHPVSMIMTNFPVIPAVCRPSTRSQRYSSSSNDQSIVECEDDLTRELHTIVTLSNQCDSSPLLLSQEDLEARYEDIQAAVERVILDAQKMQAGRRKGKAQGRFVTDSIRKRWAGKIGRVRREVMGKRVNFCARTVVTCDSSIGVDEIGVPHAVLQRITQPCPVNAYNLEAVTQMMHAGRVMFLKRDGTTKHISFIAQQTIVLEPRDTVVRSGGRYSPFHGQKCPVLPPASQSTQPTLHIPIALQNSTKRLVLLVDDIIMRGGQHIRPLGTIVWPQLRIGDVVLVNPGKGDMVLFNRQPTLVEESMLGMRIQPLPIRSFACTCAPMEAMRGDYDGDEVNLHFPQGPHTIAEVSGLLGIDRQIVTGQSSRPVVRLIHDAVVGCFWLTCCEWTGLRTFDKYMWNQIAASSFMSPGEISHRMAHNRRCWQEYTTEYAEQHGCLPNGSDNWHRSGLALLSLFIPESMEYQAPALGQTLELLHRYHPSIIRRLQIKRGIVVEGVCDSATLNGRDGIVRHAFKYHGRTSACAFLSNIQVVTAYLTYIGYNNSIGIDDCRLPPRLDQECKKSVMAMATSSLREADRLHHAESPYIEHQPLFEALLQVRRGCEAAILQWALRRSPKSAPNPDPLSVRLNQFALLTVLGTKGSISNMMQTVQSLGQQVIEGAEVKQNWTQRTLPHEVPSDDWGDCERHMSDSMFTHTRTHKEVEDEDGTAADERRLDSARYRGLVLSSFVAGLNPIEFFWHASAGREALVEGATSTASSGYAMRLCMKMSEHDVAAYDGTIRDHVNNIISPTYGENNIDGKHLIGVPHHGIQFADLRALNRLFLNLPREGLKKLVEEQN
jgi:DNA-directed RNA polymerase beta' subunit